MPKNTLLITCSAGYGHIIATENIKNRLLKENPEAKIATLDMSPYIIYPFGASINTFWDFNMRYATHMMNFLPKLMIFVHYEAIYEKLLKGPLVREIKKLIEENNIQAVYDTQPLFSNLILNTLADINPNEPFIYNKVLTDLPTEYTQHFLPGIKRIQARDNVTFKLHAQAQENSFWQTQCNITPEQLDNTFALPVNPEYLSIPDNENVITMDIPSALTDHYHLAYQNGQLTIPDNAFVTTLMLGSQGLSVIPEYVDAYIQQADKNTEQPHFFFVACSRNEKLYQALEQKICALNMPNPIILPLPMQQPSTIANLMWRSQEIIMRPSGLSCLEQLAMNQTRQDASPKIWIHAPYNKPLPKLDSTATQNKFLLEKSFGYERGNAEYLLQHLDAQLCTPQSIGFSTCFSR